MSGRITQQYNHLIVIAVYNTVLLHFSVINFLFFPNFQPESPKVQLVALVPCWGEFFSVIFVTTLQTVGCY